MISLSLRMLTSTFVFFSVGKICIIKKKKLLSPGGDVLLFFRNLCCKYLTYKTI